MTRHQATPVERRSRERFPLELPVNFRTLSKRFSYEGEGWVVNISSRGVLVAYPRYVQVGTRMELKIEVPVLLDGRVPLQIFAVGRVVRSETSRFAVAMIRHQYLTKAWDRRAVKRNR